MRVLETRIAVRTDFPLAQQVVAPEAMLLCTRARTSLKRLGLTYAGSAARLGTYSGEIVHEFR